MRNLSFYILTILIYLICPCLSYADSNRTLLIDDFNKCSNFNYLHGQMGGDEKKPGTCGFSFITNSIDTYGYNGSSLKLDFDAPFSGTYSFFWYKLGPKITDSSKATEHLDLSPYKYLSFYVKGLTGNEIFKIEIHQDTDNNHIFNFDKDIVSSVYAPAYLKKGIINKWQKVLIPLEDFAKLKDKTKTLEIVFVFENTFNKENPKSSVFIDNLILGTAFIPNDKETPRSPLRSSFKVNNKLLKDGMSFKPPVHLQVEALSALDDNSLENIHFMFKYSDSDYYRTIGYDYDTADNIYSITWPAANLPTDKTYIIQAEAEDAAGNKTRMVLPITKCKLNPLTDSEFLTLLSQRAFDYFIDYQDDKTGLISDNSQGGYASIAATGFGLAAYVIGAERGWIEKEEAESRIIKTLDTFLPNKDYPDDILAEGKDGFFYHFLDMNTAKRAGYCEVSVVDTALLACGALTAGDYFGGEIKEKAEKLYKNINWQTFFNKEKGLFYMGWSPEKGYFTRHWNFFTDEVIIISLLAIGSPTYPVEPLSYYAFKREEGTYKDVGPFIYSFNGALFCHQYAHAWFYFKDKVDKKGINWWQNSYLATLANRQFCIDNASAYKTYGPDSWGISSFYLPRAYTMHFGASPCGSVTPMHNGTVSPVGVAASMIFTPKESFFALENFFTNYSNLWGHYGLRNSFNLDRGFYAPVYYGIDRGLMLLMLENFKDSLVWNSFMKNEYMQDALDKVGFKEVEDEAIAEPQKDYPGLIESLKEQVKSIKDKNQKALLHYMIADSYIKYLETLRQNDLDKFRLYIKVNDIFHEDALKHLDRALQLTSDEGLIIDSLLDKLIIYHLEFKNNQEEKAFTELKQSIDTYLMGEVDHSFKLNRIISNLHQFGLEEYALKLQMDNIRQLPPHQAKEALDKMKKKANIFLSKEGISQAEAIYKQYLTLSKEYYPEEKIPLFYQDIADEYYKVERYQTALKYYDYIIDNFSDCKELDKTQLKIALCYKENRNYKNAIRVYKKFIQIYPDSPDINQAYLDLSEVYYIKYNSQEAITHLEKLLSSASQKVKPEIHIFIAMTYYKMENYDKAREKFEEIIKLYPDNSLSFVAQDYIKKINAAKMTNGKN